MRKTNTGSDEALVWRWQRKLVVVVEVEPSKKKKRKRGLGLVVWFSLVNQGKQASFLSLESFPRGFSPLGVSALLGAVFVSVGGSRRRPLRSPLSPQLKSPVMGSYLSHNMKQGMSSEKTLFLMTRYRITFRLCDYRQLSDAHKYDRIISCKMIEAVGQEFMEMFFSCCEAALAEKKA
ncbi:hypothetical protein DY000_02061410 [Brassica cretica]|uniref:Uncharacterized protein n=1 Tax=Brassica cretica TaxID=69181 RepID=A0ABQ7AXN3_BRACR|nr:hypothetical protein DY000_02061410 [Brassica cretica]